MLYIYQFSNMSGSKEILIMVEEQFNEKELEEATPFDTTLSQIVECDIDSGDAGILPLDRELKHNF